MLALIADVLHTLLSTAREMLLSPALRVLLPAFEPTAWSSTSTMEHSPLKNMAFEVTQAFTAHLDISKMLNMSYKMCRQYKLKLQNSSQCMLPSHNHTLPTGQETGTFLALDVGGSTFRVALVELCGRSAGRDSIRTRHMSVSPINETVRQLVGTQFFDWMAQKIQSTLAEFPGSPGTTEATLTTGLAWSFPIDQTSPWTGKIQSMGKGFSCSDTVMGQDLGNLLFQACRRRGLSLHVTAIVNDSSAALLCRAYHEPTTAIALIVGTGTNMAAHLPISCMGSGKFAARDRSTYDLTGKVITNTEASMFGKGILPRTQWDEALNVGHPLPDFQPLEYMTTGRYLGEIFRLVVARTVEQTDLFNGILPEACQTPYTVATIVPQTVEADGSDNLLRAREFLQKVWHLPVAPSHEEVQFLQTVAKAISTRATAYLAIAIHALWTLQKEYDIAPMTDAGVSRTTIACTGGVIENYPTFKLRCEEYIGQMLAASPQASEALPHQQVILELTVEGAVLGAAVAAAVTG